MAALGAQIGGSAIGSLLGSAVGTGLGVSIGMGVSTLLQPFTEIATYELNATLQHKSLDPSTLAIQRIRGIIDEKRFYAEAARNGLNAARADELIAASKKTLTVDEIIVRLRRGLIDEKKAYAEASKIGIDAELFDKIFDASEYIYTPQDLIVFLVRDVFNKEVVAKYKLDEEFPKEALKHFAKIGISEELARLYWAGHWKLPSIERATEMMYRYRPEDRKFWEAEASANGLKVSELETTLDDLRTMLKINDTTAGWREREVGIAFRPLTLRMIQQQVRLRLMDREKTEYQYRKIGFSNTDSKNNAMFAFLYESLVDWTDLLKDGRITEQDIRSEMDLWQVPRDIQDIIWTRKLEPHTEAQATKEKEIGVTYLKKGFLAGRISRDETIQGLQLLKYAEKAAKFMVEIWILENEPEARKEKVQSAANLGKLFEAGAITEIEYEKRLINEVRYTIEAAKELVFLTKLKMAKKAVSA